MFPFTLPDPVDFLELVKKLELPDNDSEEFGRVWDHIVKWLELPQPENLDFARPIIVNIARRLKDHPRLLYGLNCILQPHCRIECLTTQATVTYYVLAAKGYCEIRSMSTDGPEFPSTREDLQGALQRNDLWQEAVGSISDTQWLACIAQVLHEIIEDSYLDEACRQTARKRLYRLGKTGILPPSIFIHFVITPTSYENNIERSESGGFCDAHKITINSVPLCFRVLRQWQTSDSDKIRQQFCRELSVWRQLNHPNILPLIGATTEAFPRRYCFIIPWLLHGSIMSYLETHPDHDKYLAISQIVDGVGYLHGLDPPVIHKDLKGENVLVRSDLVCVITDFGLSGILETQRSRTTAGLGTMYWMPPELYGDDDHEYSSRDARPRDVYSLGCTAAQILTGKAPKFIWSAVIRKQELPLPPAKSSSWHQDELHLWELVRKCIGFEPEERPIIQEVKKHLEAVRATEPSRLEPTQLSLREVDRKHLIDRIKSLLRSIDIQHSPYVPSLLLSPAPTSASFSYDGGNQDITMRNPKEREIGPNSFMSINLGGPEGLFLDLLRKGKESERNAQERRKREKERDLTDLRDSKRPRSEHIRTDRLDHSSPSTGHGVPTRNLGLADGGLGLPPYSQADAPGDAYAPSLLSSGPVGSMEGHSFDFIPAGPGLNQSAIVHGSSPGGSPPLVATSFPDDIDISSVSPEYKKEGSDWFARFNSKVKRGLDVNLVHILMHESAVCCVRFSADGKHLATGGNRTAQIYDVRTGQKTCVLIDETVDQSKNLYILSVCFSPDGKYLATGADDKQIRIWDIAKKRIQNIFDGHQQKVYSLDFSLDGRLIVSGSADKAVRIWNMHDGTSKVLTINDTDTLNYDAAVTTVAISPDGRYIAAGTSDNVLIWDVTTSQLVERLSGHSHSVSSVAFTPDGKGLISGSLDATLKYWDVSGLDVRAGNMVKGQEGQNGSAVSSPCTWTFNGHKNWVLSVAVSHDGQWVVSGSMDTGVQFWDAQNALAQCIIHGHTGSVFSVDLSPAGNLLATGSSDRQVKIWSYATI